MIPVESLPADPCAGTEEELYALYGQLPDDQIHPARYHYTAIKWLPRVQFENEEERAALFARIRRMYTFFAVTKPALYNHLLQELATIEQVSPTDSK